MKRRLGLLGVALACSPAAAQDGAARRSGPEVAAGVLGHGLRERWGRLDPLPPGFIYEGAEESGTADIQLIYRSAPLAKALKPRLNARVQINTGGRTSFAGIGAEWRQHALSDRVYAQIGIGVAVHDGYRFMPDPFAPGLSQPEILRRYRIYRNNTAFGARVLFNPNVSLGVRLGRRWAVEAGWEHFSHAGVFGDQNPGIGTGGVRLVRMLGR